MCHTTFHMQLAATVVWFGLKEGVYKLIDLVIAEEIHLIGIFNCVKVHFDTITLARDSVKPSRWIREAIHIRKEQGKTIKRDLGQYALSSIYDPILSDFSTNANYVGYSGRTTFPQYIDLTKPSDLSRRKTHQKFKNFD